MYNFLNMNLQSVISTATRLDGNKGPTELWGNGQFGCNEAGSHALIQTLSQNQDPKFQAIPSTHMDGLGGFWHSVNKSMICVWNSHEFHDQ
ncbi:unnamed protein product [Sphagnum troendelagicum]|uniref:Uncharacterized protein n=1 Tax=Sphagnum troendelagicum TaxID=128251 RepID=A0ABP0UWL4_9BRYO